MNKSIVAACAGVLVAFVLWFGARGVLSRGERLPVGPTLGEETAPASSAVARPPQKPVLQSTVTVFGINPAECLRRLASVSFTNNSQRVAAARTIVQQLENLVDSGPAAVPFIRDFLSTHKDVPFPAREDSICPASLRIGLYDVLRRIGGSEPEHILVSMLSMVESGFELRHLSRVLEEMAPGRYLENIVAAARERAALVANSTGDTARREKDVAYDLLGRAGDQILVASAQAELVTSSGKINEAALRYLQRTMSTDYPQLAKQALSDPRLRDGDSREELVDSIGDVASKNPAALGVLREIASDPTFGRRERDEAFDALGEAGDFSLAQTARELIVTENGRVNETALRYLERSLGDAVLGDVAKAWADPRVQSNEEREELVQAIVGRVGLSQDATAMWQEIASNPQMPSNLREEAIGELDDRGLNRRRPGDQDRQVAATRLRLLESIVPNLQEPRLLERAQRVQRELTQVLQRPQQTAR